MWLAVWTIAVMVGLEAREGIIVQKHPDFESEAACEAFVAAAQDKMPARLSAFMNIRSERIVQVRGDCVPNPAAATPA